MKFGAIDPRTTRVEFVEAAELDAAKAAAGLHPLRVDHGVLWRDPALGRGASIVVYEFGLYVPSQRYFAIGRSLFGGPAVIYGFDNAGEAVDLDKLPPVYFFRDAEEVERAIGTGQIQRPVMVINDDVIWKWPEPPPFDIAERMRKHGHEV
jgi:hypothetical protein